MNDLKGTKTEKNLRIAFSGESEARNKYSYFASVAKKEGYEQISAFFTETAENEKEHAKLWFKLLKGIGDTAENLKSAAEGELYEHGSMYPAMAKDAREEGFENIAVLFERVADVEAAHEKRYLALLKNLEEGKVFVKDGVVLWKCRNCGYIHEGEEAPDLCPACAHRKAYFELLARNY